MRIPLEVMVSAIIIIGLLYTLSNLPDQQVLSHENDQLIQSEKYY